MDMETSHYVRIIVVLRTRPLPTALDVLHHQHAASSAVEGSVLETRIIADARPL